MGPGEAITAIIATVTVFGSIFGGIAYIVHRVLSHKRAVRQAELDAEVRIRTAGETKANDELLRAVAQELHTQRQMIETLSRQVNAQSPTPKVPGPTNLIEPIESKAPTPPEALRA